VLLLVNGLKTEEIEYKGIPNQGIQHSTKNALVGCLVLMLILLICTLISAIAIAFDLSSYKVFTLVMFGFAIGLFVGMSVVATSRSLSNKLTRAQWGGGVAAIKHYTLRLVLAWNKDAPLNLVRFLDYAAERILLRKVGGGYIFVHRMLLEYFHTEELEVQIKLYRNLLHDRRYNAAFRLYYARLHNPLFQYGMYDLQIELLRGFFPDGEDQLPHLANNRSQSQVLKDLEQVYWSRSQIRRIIPLLKSSNAINERRGDTKGVAIGLHRLGVSQFNVGQFRDAEANLRRSIVLCQEISDTNWEAGGHAELGRLLAYVGRWQEAEDALATALRLFGQVKAIQYQGVTWSYRALLALLHGRTVPDVADPAAALAHAQQALALLGENEVMHFLLGTVHLAGGDLSAAENHLGVARTRCQANNNVGFEPDILLATARLRLHQCASAEAQQLAEQALRISERNGDVITSADAKLLLARLAQQSGDTVIAQQHTETALQRAIADGPPDHCYRATYDEALALLKILAREQP
jgi:tetratricopeptide (TPR) repeat protein